ncbi:unnamed protein product [Lampetra fluviatilis]
MSPGFEESRIQDPTTTAAAAAASSLTCQVSPCPSNGAPNATRPLIPAEAARAHHSARHGDSSICLRPFWAALASGGGGASRSAGSVPLPPARRLRGFGVATSAVQEHKQPGSHVGGGGAGTSQWPWKKGEPRCQHGTEPRKMLFARAKSRHRELQGLP